jgi:excisionase family DNA binding protein
MTPRVRYLTTAEAATQLGVSRQSVAAWCRSGRLAAHHRTPGGVSGRGEWRLHPAVVEALRKALAR